jgi:hypothetical protein
MRYLIMIAIGLTTILSVSCKKCKQGGESQYVDLPSYQFQAIFQQYAIGTKWVFKSNLGDYDTYTIGEITTQYSDGTCDDSRECCKKIYYQHVYQKIIPTRDNDGLAKFTSSFYQHATYSIDGDGMGAFSFSTIESYDMSYKESLSLSGGVTFNDIKIVSHANPHKGDNGVDIVYWSLSKGLVRYDYEQADGSFISYERQDL